MSSKKKQKNKPEKAKGIPLNNSFPDTMSQEEIKNVIVASLLEYESQKKTAEEKQKREKQIEWESFLGKKDYSSRHGFSRFFLEFFDKIRVSFKMLFIPKKFIEGEQVTTVLFSMATSFIFGLAKWCLWLLSIFLCTIWLWQKWIPNFAGLSVTDIVCCVLFGIDAFIIAQLFRMASIEAGKMKDGSMLISVFSAVIAVLALVLSIVFH